MTLPNGHPAENADACRAAVGIDDRPAVPGDVGDATEPTNAIASELDATHDAGPVDGWAAVIEERYRIMLTGILAGASTAEQRIVSTGLRLLADVAGEGWSEAMGDTKHEDAGLDSGPQSDRVNDQATDPLTDAVEATVLASRALLGMVARSVSSALELVTLPQFRIMVVLATEGPLRVTTLAQRMGAVTSTFSRTLDRMVAGGWLVRAENPDSRREVLVRLSDQGRRLVEDVTERRRVEIRAALERLAPEQRATISAALATFSDAAGEPSADDLLILGLGGL